MSTARKLVVAVLGLMVGAGCSSPVVSIRHRLPAAVPMPTEEQSFEVGGFAVEGAGEFSGQEESGQAMAALVEKLAEERLADLAVPAVAGKAPEGVSSGQVIQVGGTIEIRVNDTKGSRAMRRGNPATGEMEIVEVPTLAREIEVAVDFALDRGGNGQRWVTVETRRSYRSADDPRVRGELGLGRPDNPEGVPPAEMIVRELLTENVDSFVEMIRPLSVTAKVPLRTTWSQDGNKGRESAQKGDYAAAVRHFTAESERHPDNADVRFNRAVVLEASGQLEAALRDYQQVAEQSGRKDRQAEEAVTRVQRVLQRRQEYAKK